MHGLSHQKGETYREDSSYRKEGPLAQWMKYYMKRAKPTERTPATEEEVNSHSGWFTTSSRRDLQRGFQLQRMRSTRAVDGLLHQVGETHTQDCSYRGRGRLAQCTVYYRKLARPTERTPATEGDVDSHSGRVTTSSGRDEQRGPPQRDIYIYIHILLLCPVYFAIPVIYLEWS